MFDLTQIKLQKQRTMGHKYVKNMWIRAAEQAWYACTRQTCLNRYGWPNEQNFAHQTQEQKKCFTLFDRMFDGLQMLSNSTKQGGQTVKWLVTKQCLMLFKDGAYYCYCAYVLRISRYSDFLSPMLTNTGIFLRGLKLSGESRS